jgi:putative ABC transport system permease protein
MVMRQGLLLAAAGSVLGLGGAAVAARRIGSLLYGVAPGDPLTLASVGTLAMAIALVACAVPAWRAARTEPLAGLRE